jgi:RimJ/RimL family protein N-acetyltransferase
MEFPENYAALSRNIFTQDDFSIVPIRPEHRFSIMKWRNEQIFHLRQNKVLSAEDQENYFSKVVLPLFAEDQPKQFLFSYYYKDVFCGYGGLVHINWIDSHAEISFLMDTELEVSDFELHWGGYLKLITELAFDVISLNKIYTYSYNLRPRLYPVLSSNGFAQDARLREHVFIENRWVDVLIHSKLNPLATLVRANESHLELTYSWASSEEVRRYSFNPRPIPFEDHRNWFFKQLPNQDVALYILYTRNQAAGSVRFNFSANGDAMISYLIDPSFSGQGLGTKLLKLGEQKIISEFPSIRRIFGEVMPENHPSLRIFRKLGYHEEHLDDNKIRFSKIIDRENWKY